MALVLVTGGAGFIGSHLVDRLVRDGDRVRVLDDLSTGRRENLEPAIESGLAELVIGSVLDPTAVRKAAEGCDRIYHLAACVGVRRVLADPIGGLRTNVLGTDTVLRAAREARVGSLVLFSSSEIYGRTTGGPLAENAMTVLGPTDVPRWSYAAGKVAAEYLVLGEHSRGGVPAVIVRCFNTCGPRQVGSYGMVVPTLLQQALLGEPMTVYGDGLQTRCFSYVGDVVEGVLALSRLDRARGEVFNIGTDREITILDLAHSIRSVCHSSSEVRLVPYTEAYGQGFEDVPRRVPDLSKIRRSVGYVHETGLVELLERTRDWVQSRLLRNASVV